MTEEEKESILGFGIIKPGKRRRPLVDGILSPDKRLIDRFLRRGKRKQSPKSLSSQGSNNEDEGCGSCPEISDEQLEKLEEMVSNFEESI